jgi:hypothetical protein
LAGAEETGRAGHCYTHIHVPFGTTHPQRDGDFMSLTLPFLAKKAGIGVRRAERAMHDLQLAGLVSSAQRCELTEEGRYRGLAALRQVPAAMSAGVSPWTLAVASRAGSVAYSAECRWRCKSA